LLFFVCKVILTYLKGYISSLSAASFSNSARNFCLHTGVQHPLNKLYRNSSSFWPLKSQVFGDLRLQSVFKFQEMCLHNYLFYFYFFSAVLIQLWCISNDTLSGDDCLVTIFDLKAPSLSQTLPMACFKKHIRFTRSFSYVWG